MILLYLTVSFYTDITYFCMRYHHFAGFMHIGLKLLTRVETGLHDPLTWMVIWVRPRSDLDVIKVEACAKINILETTS